MTFFLLTLQRGHPLGFLACTTSDETSAIILICVPLYVMSLFSGCSLVWLSPFFNSLVMVGLGVVYFMLSCMNGVHWASCLFNFHTIRKLLGHYFFNIFTPYSGNSITYMHMTDHLTCPMNHWGCIHFPWPFFLFSRLDEFYCCIFRFFGSFFQLYLTCY